MQKQGKKDTPLGFAVYKQHNDVVRTLLEKGADPNVLDRDECSILGEAVYYGQNEIMKMLIKY